MSVAHNKILRDFFHVLICFESVNNTKRYCNKHTDNYCKFILAVKTKLQRGKDKEKNYVPCLIFAWTNKKKQEEDWMRFLTGKNEGRRFIAPRPTTHSVNVVTPVNETTGTK